VRHIGGQGEKNMKKKMLKDAHINYEKNPWEGEESVGQVQVIDDFLPSPAAVVQSLRKMRAKITIELTQPTVEFFKREAEKHHVSYQQMIRAVLDAYADKH
jgi:predicted DNA binding CopG/RHH family protein